MKTAVIRGLGLFVWPCCLAAGQSVTLLQALPGQHAFQVGDVSADGAVVVGSCGDRATKWSRTGEVTDLGISGVALGVSGDGETILGFTHGPMRVFKWTPSEGAVVLDLGAGPLNFGLPGGGDCLDAAGQYFCGSIDGLSVRAFSEDFELLRPAARGDESSGAAGISADGQVVVGWFSYEGNNTLPFRWRHGIGAEALTVPNEFGPASAIPQSISGNGSIVVGSVWPLGGNYWFQSKAVRWRQGVAELLMDPSKASVSHAELVSDDGATILGHMCQEGPGWSWCGPFVWREATGIVRLEDFLQWRGLSCSVSQLTAISGDGRFLVGLAFTPTAGERGVLIDLGATTECVGDLDLNGSVDAGDIGVMLLGFGPCELGDSCLGDLDRSGVVDAGDIGIILLDFGPCYSTVAPATPDDSRPFMLREEAAPAAPQSR
jgi:uncharacterized membrane protein